MSGICDDIVAPIESAPRGTTETDGSYATLPPDPPRRSLLRKKKDQRLTRSEFIEGKLIRKLNSRMSPYQVSSDDFVDYVFELPPQTLNFIQSLTEPEMVKRIFNCWKRLNEFRPPLPANRACRRFRKKISRRVRAERKHNFAIAGRMGCGEGDQTMEHLAREQEQLALKRRCKVQMDMLRMLDALDPPNDSEPDIGEPGIAYPRPGPTVPGAVQALPHRKPPGRLGVIWKWCRGVVGRRSRRVGPCPESEALANQESPHDPFF